MLHPGDLAHIGLIVPGGGDPMVRMPLLVISATLGPDPDLKFWLSPDTWRSYQAVVNWVTSDLKSTILFLVLMLNILVFDRDVDLQFVTAFLRVSLNAKVVENASNYERSVPARFHFNFWS